MKQKPDSRTISMIEHYLNVAQVLKKNPNTYIWNREKYQSLMELIHNSGGDTNEKNPKAE